MSGPWQHLFVLLTASLSSESSCRDVVAFAIGIVRSKDEQLSLLRSLSQDVTALLEGPFNAAMLHLVDVTRENRDVSERRASLEKAKDLLYQAHGNERHRSFRRAMISYYIAHCWCAVGKMDDVKVWVSASREALLEYLIDRAKYSVAADKHLAPHGIGELIFIAVESWATSAWRTPKVRKELKSNRALELWQTLCALEKKFNPDSPQDADNAETRRTIEILNEINS